jgi:hypothetical protein
MMAKKIEILEYFLGDWGKLLNAVDVLLPESNRQLGGDFPQILDLLLDS